jgi:capsular exopolysaccharide synthesis family protein
MPETLGSTRRAFTLGGMAPTSRPQFARRRTRDSASSSSLPTSIAWADHVREAGDEPLLEKTLRIVRSHKWAILQALVIIPALALVLTLQQDKQYTATSSLLFNSNDVGTGPVDFSREATTNEELLQLPVVAQRTAEALGGRTSASQVEDAVDVETTPDSDIVKIHATAPTPARAAQLANSYGEAFVEMRREGVEATLQRRLEIYESAYDSLSPDEQDGQRGELLQDRINRIKLSQALRAGEAVQNAELVQAATPPTDPSSPKPVRNLILAVLLAGVVGLGLAALLDRLGGALRTEDELERLYGLPILARIPRVRSLGKQLQQHALGDDPRGNPAAEAFRTLRANLRYFGVDRDLRSILVASPVGGDGKSAVAAGLAMTMAQMGDSVVLVEADLHKDRSSEAFSEPSGRGLSTVLAGAASLDQALVETPLSHDGSYGRSLTVLRSGPIPPNASELLESERMRAHIAELEDRFDTVIIDTAPLAVVSDALALVTETSGVIAVSRLRHTRRDAAMEFRNQLAMLNAPALGVVSNYSTARSSSYYYGR